MLKKHTVKLTAQECEQVRAALRLWVTVARTSRTHPARIPGVKGEFKYFAPLLTDEAEALIDSFPRFANG